MRLKLVPNKKQEGPRGLKCLPCNKLRFEQKLYCTITDNNIAGLRPFIFELK